MPRRCRIHFVSLHSSLVNLPISLYGPLVERRIRPQALAVHLTLVSNVKKKLEAYVGWTGMASASSLAQFNTASSAEKGLETIEIDPQYAEGLGFAAGDVVEIGLLHDLPYASSVSTEPVTSDDWEILELHASHVESTLLSQVRVAVIGQEIDVWVLGRTRVRLNVVSLEPSSGKALLLTTSTEVSISPKLRAKAKASKSGSESKVSSRAASAANAASAPSSAPQEKNKTVRPARTLRVLPRRLVPAPVITAANPDDAVAFVSYRMIASLYPQGVQTSTPKGWRATVRRISSPASPDKESSPTSPLVQPVSRVLIPNDGSSSSKTPTAVPATNNEVLVLWDPAIAVPDGHVVMDPVCDNAEDWDLVRLTFVREDGDHSIPLYQSPIVSPPQPARQSHGLAGVDEVFTKCTQFCFTAFAHHAFNKRVRGVPGLLVTGRSGAGKTALLHAVSKAMQDDPRTFSYTHYVDLSRFAGSPVAKVRSHMKYWIDKASWHKPSILVLDNIDKMMGTELEHADSFHTRHITELFLALYGTSARAAAPNASGIVLLAAAESPASLHPLLNSSHLFREVVHLKPPSKDARKEVLAHLVDAHMDSSDITQDPAAPLNYTALATQTEGYSVTDLKDLVARAVHRAAIRSSEAQLELGGLDEAQPTTLTPADFASAQVDFVPHSLRDVKLQKSDIVWADIGGLGETKRVLRETLEWPTKYGPIFAQSPLRLRSGLLLYGYPGCGKTLLASAVAKECGLNFISIKGPELLNKYIGASEQSVRDLFERASAAKPCVLFFDEFDSIAPKRGHDSTGVTDRVVNQMLTQMDGAEGLEGVYVLAATSRPDLIDSALLRPGRLDKSLLCDMPDAAEREEILTALGRKVAFAPSVDLGALAAATDGFSGADLQALVYNAHLEVVHDAIAALEGDGDANGNGKRADGGGEREVKYMQLGTGSAEGAGSGARVMSRAEESALQRRLQRIVSATDAGSRGVRARGGPSPGVNGGKAKAKHEIGDAHLARVLKATRPSVPAEERERLRRIYGAFVSDRSGDLPVPPEAGGVGNRVSLA